MLSGYKISYKSLESFAYPILKINFLLQYYNCHFFSKGNDYFSLNYIKVKKRLHRQSIYKYLFENIYFYNYKLFLISNFR